MSAELPPDIVVVESDGATRYVLPRPALGIARVMGGVLVVVGLGPAAMGVFFLREVADQFGGAPDPFVIGRLLSYLCPSTFILIGGLMSFLGVWWLAGRAEIVLTPGEIVSAFRWGPLAGGGRRQRRLVRRLVVERSSRGPGSDSDLASLVAETDADRPLVLASFYSPEWLASLAAELARRSDTGEGPLPVIERAAGQATSRRWRRTIPAEGTRRAPGWALFVGGSMFFVTGVFCFVAVLQELIRGGLGGAGPEKLLGILFPFPFIVSGALILVHAFRRRKTVGLSPEQMKVAKAKAPAPQDEAGEVAAARAAPEAEYPTVPAVSPAPGAELSVRLTQGAAPGWGVAILLGLVLLCSGIITPLAVYAVGAFRAGQRGAAIIPGFIALFLSAIGLKLTGLLVTGTRLWRMGCPVVEISALPLYCGEPCEVVVTVHGPLILSRLRVAVLCEEEVSYTDGEDRRNDTRRVHDQELTSRENLDIECDDPLRVSGVIHVPTNAMHSFKAEHSEVRWVVRVEGEARRLFRLPFCHDYRLAVRPRRGFRGAT